jgi:hypothetical protein
MGGEGAGTDAITWDRYSYLFRTSISASRIVRAVQPRQIRRIKVWNGPANSIDLVQTSAWGRRNVWCRTA